MLALLIYAISASCDSMGFTECLIHCNSMFLVHPSDHLKSSNSTPLFINFALNRTQDPGTPTIIFYTEKSLYCHKLFTRIQHTVSVFHININTAVKASKPMITFCTTIFNIKKFYTLRTESISVFFTDIGKAARTSVYSIN